MCVGGGRRGVYGERGLVCVWRVGRGVYGERVGMCVGGRGERVSMCMGGRGEECMGREGEYVCGEGIGCMEEVECMGVCERGVSVKLHTHSHSPPTHTSGGSRNFERGVQQVCWHIHSALPKAVHRAAKW